MKRGLKVTAVLYESLSFVNVLDEKRIERLIEAPFGTGKTYILEAR